MSTKQVTLWSFLTQSSAKREIFCPDDLRVSVEEFADELAASLTANKLPAAAELVTINWDGTNRTQRLILIRYTGTQAATDVLQFAVGLEHLGSFAYLEKRMYVLPPQLPESKSLQNPQKSDDYGFTGILFLYSVLCLGVAIGFLNEAFQHWNFEMRILLIFLIGLISLTGSLVFAVRGIKRMNRVRVENLKIAAWARTKEQTDTLRKKNLTRWQEETLEIAYLAQTTDVFGRWTSAISTTIDQVVQKLFVDRHAQAKQWQEERKSQEEIEKALKQRSAEAFG